MAKVRCTWVDRPTINGFEVGMVFEAEEVSEGFFTINSLVWARRKLPFDGKLWKFELVE